MQPAPLPVSLKAWHLLLGLGLLRLLFLPFFCSIYDLAGDESYYWDWGRRPDWGYYSKPPMIGWLMGVTGALTGNSEWGIRLAALAVGTVSLALLYQLAKQLFNATAGVLALALAALTPANVGLNLFFTIDAPLILFWTGALLAFWRASQEPGRAWGWVVLAIAMGLGHLSKQMMLLFPVLMASYAMLTPAAGSLLKRPGFWMSIAGSYCLFLPVLWWNHHHQWITVEHTKHHFGAAADITLSDRAGDFFAFAGSQAALFTPITWLGLLTVAGTGLWQWKRLDHRGRFLIVFSAPALIVFHLLALRQSVNPNWPAVFYLPGMVLLAAAWAGQAPGLQLAARFQRLARPALGVAAVFTVLSYALPLGLWAASRSGEKALDPMTRLYGWQDAGRQAGTFLDQSPRPKDTVLLALGHRENASQFAFYTPQQPRAYRWQADGTIASQYEIWPSAGEAVGKDFLILQPTESDVPRSLAKQFTSVKKVGEIEVPLGKTGARKWQVFLGTSLQRWSLPGPGRHSQGGESKRHSPGASPSSS